MRLLGKLRFSIGAIMMFVFMVAAGAALFVKIRVSAAYAVPLFSPGWPLLAIVLTTAALGAWKNHSATQLMLQTALVCLICLSSYWFAESSYQGAILYWYEGVFALTVTVPMLAWRHVESAFPVGPRRDWWKKTCEAVLLSFLTVLITAGGSIFQSLVHEGFHEAGISPGPSGSPFRGFEPPDPQPSLAPWIPGSITRRGNWPSTF